MAGEKECLVQAFICCESSMYCPSNIDNFCACLDESLCCGCFVSNSACCLMSKHPMFAGINGGQENVCCVSSGASAVVKPLCLIGEQPCCKDVSQGGCCTNKAEYPPTGDIDPRVATMFIKCCNCCPFACDPKICDEVKPIGDLSGAGNLSDVNTATEGEHFLLMSCCCYNLSEYIPDTYVDAFGSEGKGVCCCFECDVKNGMLPKDQGGYKLLIERIQQIKCVSPYTCCKGTARQQCFQVKCAFPMDEDVPFAIACCNLKCCGNPGKYKIPHFFTKTDELTGSKGGAPESSEMAR